MKSKTLIKKQAKRKLNPEIVETIFLCKKNEKWIEIARILSRPRRKRVAVNLDKINEQTKEGDTTVIPGKVLGSGMVEKKIRIAALSFSQIAIEKLKKTKSEIVTIKQEVKINPKAQGIKLIK